MSLFVFRQNSLRLKHSMPKLPKINMSCLYLLSKIKNRARIIYTKNYILKTLKKAIKRFILLFI